MTDTASLIERLRAYRGSEDAQVLMDEAADALAGLKAERDEEFYWKNEAMSRHAEAEAALARADSDRAALATLAKAAKSSAAAPDYDEEAIRDALWALVDAALAAVEPEREADAVQEQGGQAGGAAPPLRPPP